MKQFLKNNWFKIAIIFIGSALYAIQGNLYEWLRSLPVVGFLFQQKTTTVETC